MRMRKGGYGGGPGSDKGRGKAKPGRKPGKGKGPAGAHGRSQRQGDDARQGRSKGRGQGQDRDERNKERSRERYNPRKPDQRGNQSFKRDTGRGRAIPARPPREAPAPVIAPPPPVDLKPQNFSAGVQNVTVTADENNMRVDRFFEARFPGLSFSHIQRIIRKGEVRVDGKRTEPKSRLEAGQAIRIPPLQLARPVPRDDAPQAQKDRAFIRSITLHEDDDVLVLNKPAGLAV
ncbi:MAG: S4 domain-containing protein, partial [Pseudolabrys sp.]